MSKLVNGLLVLLSLKQHPIIDDCTLDLHNISLENQPIFLKNNKLAIPELDQDNGVLIFREKDKIKLACPGKDNHLNFSTKGETVRGICKRGGFVIDGGNIDKQDLICNNTVESKIEMTGKNCGNIPTAKIFRIGFKIESKLVELMKGCYNSGNATTLYIQHKVYDSIKGSQIQSNRPNFQVGEKQMFKGMKPDQAYTINHQVQVFEQILGSKEKAQDMINKSDYFARGHLAPHCDFLFSSWQFATYYYANVNPQFQSINAGHWLEMEKAVRRLAERLRKTLHVTTGTCGTLFIKGKHVYLDDKNKGIPIPKEFFKIVYEPTSKRGIVLVCSNNPILQKAPRTLCKKDICGEYKWPVLQNDFKKGYCYCCNTAEFYKAVPFVPQYKIRGVLSSHPVSKEGGIQFDIA